MGICKLELNFLHFDSIPGLLFPFQRLYFLSVYIGSKVGSSAAVSQHFALDPNPNMTQTSIYCSNREALSFANRQLRYLTQTILCKSKIKPIYALSLLSLSPRQSWGPGSCRCLCGPKCGKLYGIWNRNIDWIHDILVWIRIRIFSSLTFNFFLQKFF